MGRSVQRGSSSWARARLLTGISAYTATVRALESFDADLTLSTHLPPALGIGDHLFATLLAAPAGPRFVAPDQAALEQMLAGLEHPAPVS